MGLYNVVCQECQTRFQWFSGALNQLCKQCNDKLVNDSNENKSIFSKLTEQEMHDLLNPHAKDGRIIDALKKELDELKAELTQCKQALEQTNDGRPSEWAYSILRKERDELKAEVERLKGEHAAFCENAQEKTDIDFALVINHNHKLQDELESEQAKSLKYREALAKAAIRLKILTGRMRGCNEETGQHELLDEAEMFCVEADQALERDE